MDEAQHHAARIAKVYSLLEAQLGAVPGDGDRYGSGIFTHAAAYGRQGELGDTIWQVRRTDDRLRRYRQVPVEWRSFTPEKVAELLIQTYDKLGQ